MTLVDFPQLETSSCEVDDGHSCFDEKEAEPCQKPKESWADVTPKGGPESEIRDKEHDVSELRKKLKDDDPVASERWIFPSLFCVGPLLRLMTPLTSKMKETTWRKSCSSPPGT